MTKSSILECLYIYLNAKPKKNEEIMSKKQQESKSLCIYLYIVLIQGYTTLHRFLFFMLSDGPILTSKNLFEIPSLYFNVKYCIYKKIVNTNILILMEKLAHKYCINIA